MNYYVPVTSYKQQKPANFLIKAANGQFVSFSLFNYIFPVPGGLISERIIANELDRAYRALLSQELLLHQKPGNNPVFSRTYI